MTQLHSPDQCRSGTGLPDIAMPAALLFDCDGTLLLTGDLHFKAISDALLQQGARMTRDWYMALTGMGRDDLFARFRSEHPVALDLPRATSDSIAQTVLNAAAARENPTVVNLARKAHGRLPMAVVTNSEAPIAEAFLAATGLRHLFDLVITREDARDPKPAPDLYLTAAARLGVARQDCIVLEDSAEGLHAATACGMRGYDVRLPGWPMQADALIQTLASLPMR
ncbi:HAD family phosphatase [Roseibaca sp. V10]|uniref:HAD family phosphatase n=1 Tax=Roseinatronobacter domitianus TaxID=2940293 RepID=A0ABT0M1K5_9RHOB|nr:HAD family phosphatase [Roseibaca domitiana]MCL1628747.1 HAD family phosphatase [Roseibaca domitiana]